jgi:hypothetical protein
MTVCCASNDSNVVCEPTVARDPSHPARVVLHAEWSPAQHAAPALSTVTGGGEPVPLVVEVRLLVKHAVQVPVTVHRRVLVEMHPAVRFAFVVSVLLFQECS